VLFCWHHEKVINGTKAFLKNVLQINQSHFSITCCMILLLRSVYILFIVSIIMQRLLFTTSFRTLPTKSLRISPVSFFATFSPKVVKTIAPKKEDEKEKGFCDLGLKSELVSALTQQSKRLHSAVFSNLIHD